MADLDSMTDSAIIGMAATNGWERLSHPLPFQLAFEKNGVRAILTVADGMVHLSISLAHRIPNYEEMKQARYDLIPNGRWMAQVFPPPKYFVNIHPNVLHLWEVQGDERWKAGTI